MQLVPLATAWTYPCAGNQYPLADAIGLMAIHLTRTLRHLRERRLMSLKGGRVTIHDLAGLTTLAEFGGGYLDQRAAPI